MKTRILLSCIFVVLNATPALADCVEVPGQLLTSITLDFKSSMPASDHVPVNCNASDHQKSCVCSAAQLSYLGDTHRSFTFIMKPNLGGKNGYLDGPGDVGASLRCGNYKVGGLTPNLTMLREFLAVNPTMLQSCTFSNRAKYPDEVKEASVGASKNGDADRKLIVDALNSANGDYAEAAKKLGISEKALLRKMKGYNILTTAQ